MLHWWLIPVLIFLLIALWGFYLVVRRSGGSGVRTDGRTLMDKPGADEDLPPGI